MSEVCDVRVTSRAARRRLLFPFVDAGWLQATRRDKRLEDSEFPFPSLATTRSPSVPKAIIANMAIDLPLRSEQKPTKTTPGKSAQNGLPTHSGQEEAGTKTSPGIPSGIIV
jgi:hypothetical protein